VCSFLSRSILIVKHFVFCCNHLAIKRAENGTISPLLHFRKVSCKVRVEVVPIAYNPTRWIISSGARGTRYLRPVHIFYVLDLVNGFCLAPSSFLLIITVNTSGKRHLSCICRQCTSVRARSLPRRTTWFVSFCYMGHPVSNGILWQQAKCAGDRD
jgi:hypothetical protein